MIRTGIAALQLQLNAVSSALKGGSLEIRGGTLPGSPSDAPTGSALVVIPIGVSDVGPATASGNDAEIDIEKLSAEATRKGTATWFCVRLVSGEVAYDGTVTAPKGRGDAVIPSVDIEVGMRVTLLSLTIALPM